MSEAPTPHYRRFFYRLLYTPSIFGLVDRVNRALGREGTTAVAEVIAHAYIATHPAIVAIAARNIRLLVPSLPSEHLARKAFLNFARGLADYWTAGNLPAKEVAALCDERTGFEHLREVIEGGRGAILATGHYGQFELGAVLLAERGFPITVLTLSEPTPEMTRWRSDFRARWGAETIEIGSNAFNAMEIVRCLQRGRFCAMLVDRPYCGDAIGIDLPGGRIPFSTSAALLASLADCPILPVVIRRKPNGFYYMSARRPVRVDRSLPRREALEKATRETAEELIPEFLADPSHWYHFVPLETQ